MTERFHTGGVMKVSNARLLVGEKSEGFVTPRGRVNWPDFPKSGPRSERISFRASFDKVFQKEVKRFAALLVEDWVAQAVAALQTRIDEEGCGTFFAAVKSWDGED